MLVKDFDYYLPKELIAQKPLRPRDRSRLLVLSKTGAKISHEHFFDLPKHLRPGDLLVFNNTKVFKARLFGKLSQCHPRESGDPVCDDLDSRFHGNDKQQVEIFLLRPVSEYSWQALAKPGKKLFVGSKIVFSKNLHCRVQEKKAVGVIIVKFNQPRSKLLAVSQRIGHIPVPPYIGVEPKKLEDYQTIYAKNVGSVAAPTAGFHFTPHLLHQLKKQGIEFAYITLHVGLGTFQPIKTERVEEHEMHSEWVEINKKTAEMIARAKKDGRRVIAVGTTTVRALEGAVKEFPNDKFSPCGGSPEGRQFPKYKGEVNIFIIPGYKFRVIDGLITNFHLPKSTLLMLVSALVGREKILRAYRLAIKNKYRFFSFGDAMLII